MLESELRNFSVCNFYVISSAIARTEAPFFSEIWRVSSALLTYLTTIVLPLTNCMTLR